MIRRTRQWLSQLWVPHSLRFQLLSRSLLILAGLLLIVGVSQYIFMGQFMYRNQAASLHSQMRGIPVDALYRRGAGSGNEGSAAREGSSPETPGSGGAANPGAADPSGGGAPAPAPGNSGGNAGDSTFRRDGLPPLFTEVTIAHYGTNGTWNVLQENTAGRPAPRLSDSVYQNVLQSGKSGEYYYRTKDSEGNDALVVLQLVRGRTQGVLQASMGTERIQEVLLSQLVTFLVLSALALVLGLLTFIPVLRRLLVPLSQVVDTVEKLHAENLHDRLPVHRGQLEIDRLSHTFNGMLERLEASFTAEKEAKEQMRRFIADASHELRTPLTSIHGFLEVLQRGAATNPEQLQRALRSMYGESGRIIKLVQDLLLLTRLDQTPALQFTRSHLDVILTEMEPQLRLLAGERTVKLSLLPDTQAWIDPDKIKQVILNLFHNAVQHTDPQHGTLEVELSQQEESVVLTVRDNGTGIAAEHLPHLFERFYRIDSSRNRKQGGSGLGLAITASIVEIHRGSIAVESTPGVGTAFHVHLPSRPPG